MPFVDRRLRLLYNARMINATTILMTLALCAYAAMARVLRVR